MKVFVVHSDGERHEVEIVERRGGTIRARRPDTDQRIIRGYTRRRDGQFVLRGLPAAWGDRLVFED